MRRAKLGVVVVVLAAGLLGAYAEAAAPVPSAVRAAVDKWTKTALHIQDSKIALAIGQVGATSAHAQAGCSYPQSRAGLASAIDTIANFLEGYVRNTERGELGLYKLAPRLGPKRGALRKAYVKQLDAVGKALDFELADVKNIHYDAARVDSSGCLSGLTDLDTNTGFLTSDHKRADRELKKLRAQFG